MLSLWAIPVGARSFQRKYNAKRIPHVTLVENVSPRERAHECFPPTMNLKIKNREMIMRKVKDKYEYGWVFDDGSFMTCHEVGEGETPPPKMDNLDVGEMNAIVVYSCNDRLVDIDDIGYSWAD